MRARKRRSEPIALGELVPAVFGPNNSAIAVSRISAVWERVLSPRIAKNASPTRLKERVLFVETTTSAWAQEITLMAPTLLEKLRAGMPSLEVDSLRVRASAHPKRASADRRRPPTVAPLAEAELPTALQEELARVEDDPLRDVLTRAARQSLAHRSPPSGATKGPAPEPAEPPRSGRKRPPRT